MTAPGRRDRGGHRDGRRAPVAVRCSLAARRSLAGRFGVGGRRRPTAQSEGRGRLRAGMGGVYAEASERA